MLRIYETMIEVLKGLRPVAVAIEAHDGDLARQLRRASSSVALNISEGSGSSAGTRRERYRKALGSARETGACLDVAMACGCIDGVDTGLLDRLDDVERGRRTERRPPAALGRPRPRRSPSRSWRGAPC